MYSTNEETFWTNQQLYFYKDKTYNSNGTLEINVSTTTKDYIYFNAATLNFKVGLEGDFKRQKVSSLNYSKVLDLHKILKQLLFNSDPYATDTVIQRRYSDKDFIIAFKKSTSSGEKCVIIRIMNNDSDLVQVIIPFSEIEVVFNLLEMFKENFMNITHQMKNHSFNLKQMTLLEQISNGIKILPSMITGIDNPETVCSTPDTNNIEVNDSFNQMSELDNFLGGSEMENIEIPEVEKDNKRASQTEPVAKREIESKFVNEILENDIMKLEEMLVSSYSKSDSINSLFSTIEIGTNEYYGNFAHMNDDEEKSLHYLSKLIFNSMLRNYLDNNIPIPSAIPTLKHKHNPVMESNIVNNQLAYDLLTIYAYLKTYRNRIESKTDDIESTKAIVYLAFRCFTDWFVTSPLENMNVTEYKTAIIDRFKDFESKGFFNKYNETLEKYNLSIVNEYDVSAFVDAYANSLVENKGKLYIPEMHEAMYKEGQVKLPARNKLSREQIINDIVKLEVAMKLDNNLNIQEYSKRMGIELTDEVKKIYINEEAPKKTDEVKETKTNLMRFFKNNEQLLEIAKTIGNKDFNFESINLNLKDLTDETIKALYLWKPQSDEKVTKNFNYFTKLVNDLSMSKNDIINLVENSVNTSESSEWDISLEAF